MKLNEMHAADGRPLHRALESVLTAVETDNEAVTELYTSLWDIHDGARRVVSAIEELAVQNPQDGVATITRLLFKIQAELYNHMSDHLDSLRPVLDQTATRLADRLDTEATA
jgi:hypothetical protein